jgi:NADH:ubiquinone oxidoreductase subunit 6 (subunit J)
MTTTFTLDQLKAQLDDAEETVIALRMIADIAQDKVREIQEQLRQAQTIRLTISRQYVLAIEVAQMKEQANA